MNDIIGLRIIAEEYRNTVSSLFGNPYYVAEQSKNAIVRLRDAFHRTAENKKNESIITRTSFFYDEADRLRKRLEEFPETEEVRKTMRSAEVLERKVGTLDEVLTEVGIVAIVKEEKIEFLNNGNVILRLSLQDEAAKV